jgi:hypothetical protein
MIPYDDLVAALSAWRARQGLPVSTMGAPVAATPTAPEPYTAPRSTPPAAPSRGKPSARPATAPHEAEEVDAAILDDASLEPESADYALSFGDGADGATAVGGTPSKDKTPARGGRRGDDEW